MKTMRNRKFSEGCAQQVSEVNFIRDAQVLGIGANLKFGFESCDVFWDVFFERQLGIDGNKKITQVATIRSPFTIF